MIKKLWAVIMNEAVPTCPLCQGQNFVCGWIKETMYCWDCGHAEKIGKTTVPWRWLGVRR